VKKKILRNVKDFPVGREQHSEVYLAGVQKRENKERCLIP
jgi:hypothetical protein